MSEFLLSTERKREIAEDKLRGAKPLVISSAKDGIVLVTEKVIIRKTAKIYDKIAFGAIGSIAELEKIKKMLIIEADKKGFTYARRDVHIEPLVIFLAEFFENVYSDPRYLAYGVKIALAEIGDAPENDKILTIDYEGGVENIEHKAYIILANEPEHVEKKINNLLKGKTISSLTMNSAINLIKEAISNTRNTEKNKNPIKFEVSVLERINNRDRFKRLEKGGL